MASRLLLLTTSVAFLITTISTITVFTGFKKETKKANSRIPACHVNNKTAVSTNGLYVYNNIICHSKEFKHYMPCNPRSLLP